MLQQVSKPEIQTLRRTLTILSYVLLQAISLCCFNFAIIYWQCLLPYLLSSWPPLRLESSYVHKCIGMAFRDGWAARLPPQCWHGPSAKSLLSPQATFAAMAATLASTANTATANLGPGSNSKSSLGDPWYPRLSQEHEVPGGPTNCSASFCSSAEPCTCKLQTGVSVPLIMPMFCGYMWHLWLRKHKFKDKIIKNFKKSIAEH